MADERIGASKGSRPKLAIPYTKCEVCCEIVSAFVLIGTAIYLAVVWAKLPAQVPVHFNIMGQPDRWGNPNGVILLFGVLFALYAGISVIERFPHVYNYPFGLTPQNVHRQYQLARELLILIKTEIVCSFAFIQFGIVNVAQGRSRNLGLWCIPAMIVAILITIVQYCVRASKAR